jgi:hypothetical protein
MLNRFISGGSSFFPGSAMVAMSVDRCSCRQQNSASASYVAHRDCEGLAFCIVP